MYLAFTDELNELIEEIEGLEKEIEGLEAEINKEAECYGYGIDNEIDSIRREHMIEANETILKPLLESIVEFKKNIPDTRVENMFVIGKKRREEIYNLLDNLYMDMYELDIDTIECIDIIPILDKHKEYIKSYISKDIKTIVNERKKNVRRNEHGFTRREQNKEDKIKLILELKEQGYTQSQVSSKLNLSKGLVSRYWSSKDFVNLTKEQKIELIPSLKERGFTKNRVSSRLNLSRSLVLYHWESNDLDLD